VAGLLESHIIPKFAIRWMKETGTGYFRGVDEPNVRLQDGSKEYLLCAMCEQLFATRESYFASHLFRPLLAGTRQVSYDERFAYFVVSLLWRAVQRNLVEAKRDGFRFLDRVEAAETEWRQFLLAPTALPDFGHLHVFVADIAERNPPGVPKFNLYCSRAIDTTLFDLEERGYVVVKFARFFFVGMLTPYAESHWKGTRVQLGNGMLKIPQIVEDLAFGGWLMARAKFAYEKFDAGVSSKQLQVIRDHVRKKFPSLQNSDLLCAANADHTDEARVLAKAQKTGRNDKCPCGSGLKFKKCHGR
jgi:hypothetical protein